MKLIHCADLHLGSRLTKLSESEIRETRKRELLNSFNRLIEYAKANDIHFILLSGDIFDSNRPTKKDKSFFYDAIKANREITFLYLKGNHDIEESFEEHCDNLLLFDDDWKSYQFEDFTISGIELSESNKTSCYSSLSLDKDSVNIVMMHGDINVKGKDFIDIKSLAKKNIDYLALGHIHSYSESKIDNRGVAVYPGCLEGRGFDELGTKGFVILNIENKEVSHKFIPFSSRMTVEKYVDISSANNLYEANDIVQSEVKDISSMSLVKVVLTGKVKFDISNIEKDIYSFLNDKFFYLKVKNEIKVIVNIENYDNDFSLRGEFVRSVSSNNKISEEQKEEILNIGIKLLNGEDIE